MALLSALLIFVCSLLMVSTAGAQDASSAPPEARAQAERYFRAGVSLQKVEDFEAAIAAYRASLTTLPTKSAWFNLANCQRALHRYAEALASLQQLQSRFGEELEEPMLSATQAQLEELRNLTATLLIETQPTGASVSIDGTVIGTTPWTQPATLSLGHHVVEAALEGFGTEQLAVELLPRAKETRELTLKPTSQPAQSTPSPSAATEPRVVEKAAKAATERPEPYATDAAPSAVANTSRQTWGWLGVALGATAAAGGAFVGIQALTLDKELSRACDNGVCPEHRRDDLQRLDRLTSSANLLLGAGALVAAGGATLVLWSSEPQSSQTRVGVNVTPRFIGLVSQGQLW